MRYASEKRHDSLVPNFGEKRESGRNTRVARNSARTCHVNDTTELLESNVSVINIKALFICLG